MWLLEFEFGLEPMLEGAAFELIETEDVGVLKIFGTRGVGSLGGRLRRVMWNPRALVEVTIKFELEMSVFDPF